MVKCAGCGKFVGTKDVALCNICNNTYHLACVHLKQSPKVEWKCQCCKKTASSRSSLKQVDAEGTPSSAVEVEISEDSEERSVLAPQTDLGREMRFIRKELLLMKEELKNELREIRREVSDLRQTVTTCSTRIDSLESRVVALENRQEGAASEDLQCKFQQTVAHLKSELNDREQELLSSDLEITNLPEGSGENIIHTVEVVARKLGVSLDTRDIVFAERVGPRHHQPEDRDDLGSTAGGRAGSSGARPRRIVVRLARRALRDELLRSARARRGATSDDLGLQAPPTRFYLNERLTRINKHLFYCARQAAERLGWRYTWTKGGRILTKQGDGKRTMAIRSADDLTRVFGSDATKDILG